MARSEPAPTVPSGGESRELDVSEIATRPTVIPYGARGRDPGGYPKLIPVGVPPALAGEPHRIELPKEMEIPPRPFKAAERLGLNTGLVAGTPGDAIEIIDEEVGFPVSTIQIDNFTALWLWCETARHLILPLSVGWCIPIYRSVSRLRIVTRAPGGYAQGVFVAGTYINAICYEDLMPFSPGVPIPATQHP